MALLCGGGVLLGVGAAIGAFVGNPEHIQEMWAGAVVPRRRLGRHHRGHRLGLRHRHRQARHLPRRQGPRPGDRQRPGVVARRARTTCSSPPRRSTRRPSPRPASASATPTRRCRAATATSSPTTSPANVLDPGRPRWPGTPSAPTGRSPITKATVEAVGAVRAHRRPVLPGRARARRRRAPSPSPSPATSWPHDRRSSDAERGRHHLRHARCGPRPPPPSSARRPAPSRPATASGSCRRRSSPWPAASSAPCRRRASCAGAAASGSAPAAPPTPPGPLDSTSERRVDSDELASHGHDRVRPARRASARRRAACCWPSRSSRGTRWRGSSPRPSTAPSASTRRTASGCGCAGSTSATPRRRRCSTRCSTASTSCVLGKYDRHFAAGWRQVGSELQHWMDTQRPVGSGRRSPAHDGARPRRPRRRRRRRRSPCCRPCMAARHGAGWLVGVAIGASSPASAGPAPSGPGS